MTIKLTAKATGFVNANEKEWIVSSDTHTAIGTEHQKEGTSQYKIFAKTASEAKKHILDGHGEYIGE